MNERAKVQDRVIDIELVLSLVNLVCASPAYLSAASCKFQSVVFDLTHQQGNSTMSWSHRGTMWHGHSDAWKHSSAQTWSRTDGNDSHAESKEGKQHESVSLEQEGVKHQSVVASCQTDTEKNITQRKVTANHNSTTVTAQRHWVGSSGRCDQSQQHDGFCAETLGSSGRRVANHSSTTHIE